nr:PREDICTED: MAM and LDL-receptor class A domain-containing protein 1-like [Latimeria chalumnae]|eukprot:XP_014344169.1 PREDICTED: MAM and LDL-receptor class A domain-containing protein 1-like [Latimeria chalumnae]
MRQKPQSSCCSGLGSWFLEELHCGRFHFYMYGLEVGTLQMILEKKSSGSQSIIWSISNSTRNQWNAEYVYVGELLGNYRIIFSASPRLNPDNSPSATDDIGVDDISFQNSLLPNNCSFESNLCGWVQGATDSFDWERKVGPTDTLNTGPSEDHTTGTGYYLYIESSNPRRVNDVAQFRSLLIPPTGAEGYCLTFWYHMYGATVGDLSVYLRRSQFESKRLVWQRRGTMEDEWREAHRHVILQEVHEILIEATVGGTAGDIAIDDIAFTHGACPVQDVCDFEENDCNWIQSEDDDYDWARSFGETPTSDTGPSFDHTTNTATGYYLYLETSSPHLPGNKAIISTPAYPAGGDRCLQFWYHMYGAGIGRLNVYKHDTIANTSSLLFHQYGDQGVLWRFAQASLTQVDKSPFKFSDNRHGVLKMEQVALCYILSTLGPIFLLYLQIVFGGIKGKNDKGDIAIDDILIFNGSCVHPGFCDFEKNLCGWTNIKVVDETDWLRNKGGSSNVNSGPNVDHTTNTTQGYYLYVDSSRGSPGDRAMLVSEIFESVPEGCCLTFWYHMYGQDVGTLRIYGNNRTMQAASNKYGVCLWSQLGNQGNTWFEAMVPVDFLEQYWTNFTLVFFGIQNLIDILRSKRHKSDTVKFIFEYEKGAGVRGRVAIDDIELHHELCNLLLPTTAIPTIPPTFSPTINDCNFEVDLCSWKQDQNDDFDWRRQPGSSGLVSMGPVGDHTTGSTRGYYIVIEASHQVKGAKARIRSVPIPMGSEGLCLKFWYHMFGKDIDALNVYYKKTSSEVLLWKKRGAWGPQWNFAQVHIVDTGSIEIIFEGKRGTYWNGDIALDDIAFNLGPCPSARECDFENGKCGFTQDTTDDIDWTLGSGATDTIGIGPGYDHSYGSSYGHYMYIDASAPSQPGDIARLDSPIYPPSTQCLRFWYHMYGVHTSFLRVYLKRRNSTELVLSKAGNQGNEWNVALVNLTSPTEFQITFEGVIGSGVKGDVAIDDVNLQEGPFGRMKKI